ncbi:MAG: hypothetical protein FWE21_02420 [Defluviitaleaceae bacterium]|nr:hypothetical protein [Defluviitaleaceae bacterium]
MDKSKLNVKPMERYEAPKIPTLYDVYKNPEPLKKLPARWAKNALVAASIGILGLSTMAGCNATRYTADGAFCRCNQYGVGYNGYEEFDLVVRIHHGGAGGAGYVIHLTEQETLGIIRNRLETVGLNFCDTPPNYNGVGTRTSFPNAVLNLFDARNNVAISYLGWDVSAARFSQWGRELAERIEGSFAEQTNINIRAFYTPMFFPWEWDWNPYGQWVNGIHIPPEPPPYVEQAEAKAEARPILEERLNEQIDDFITFLRSQRIIRR